MAARRPITLALDQGTSSSKAAVIDGRGRVLGAAFVPVASWHGPRGAVHQDPRQLLASQMRAVRRAVMLAGHPRLDAAGVASQRSTIVIWDRASGRPRGPAPTWQSTEAADVCRRLARHAAAVRRRTGLFLSPHYSASKLSRRLARDKRLMAQARRGDAVCGSVATWLIWNLTGGRIHAIDPTLAARTLLFALRSARWDPWLLDLFGIPRPMLPETRAGIGDFGAMTLAGATVPITACLGDQQAALHASIAEGRRNRALVNYGTGAFALMPTGSRPVRREGLLTSFMPSLGAPRYMLEGSVNPAGAALDWLRRELGAPGALSRLDAACRSAPGGATVLASFWGMGSRDMILNGKPGPVPAAWGLSPLATRAQLVRATVESIAHAVADAVGRSGGGHRPRRLVASGGLAGLDYLVSYQAALLGAPVEVQQAARGCDATLYGVARAAARGLGHDLPVLRARRVVVPARRLRLIARADHRRWLRLLDLAQAWSAAGAGAA